MRWRFNQFALLVTLIFPASPIAFSQKSPGVDSPSAQVSLQRYAHQTAQILGMEADLKRLLELRAQKGVGSIVTLEKIAAKQQFLESVDAATLDVDSVLAELESEQSEISSVRTTLEARRDKKVNRLTVAALLAGSGVGTAVSATQFTTLGSTTQNVGDGVGIASGVATTILSVLAARAQNGPRGTVPETPNMLAPLLGGTPVLNTYYPPAVLRYLETVPAGEDPNSGTRLEQLIARWDRTGELVATDSNTRKHKILALTSSGDSKVKVSIEDLNDRIAMLGDVRGRVLLLKRDLATIVRISVRSPD